MFFEILMRFMFWQAWADGGRDRELSAAVAVTPLGANSHNGMLLMHSHQVLCDDALGNHNSVTSTRWLIFLTRCFYLTFCSTYKIRLVLSAYGWLSSGFVGKNQANLFVFIIILMLQQDTNHFSLWG